ncbi:MAG: cytochrome ubiquinol oxidase subunit I [Candidatus Tectomicrobia bacterium]|uniref:Cytochrome ubiquinol oxidase subunit I n=1 Tax=Tectimicrobiota bacterium TaxID=2528274 RepID=A0A932CLU6_UNCTE|nr:cytochrome ubiquinol oxidase subunit I [Candidatus Tectomicrobia bacterium]
MHYPWWYVPFLTSPMLIAIVAVMHVIVSHYAVGGGFFLAVETQYAYRTHDRDYLAYLQEHAWFFILVTVAYGAITGVGIWWTIGLASPLATEMLIHIFVFGWAIEYVFFIVEIASAFIFFYYWGRLDPKTHRIIGWIYAISAWISLVLITGITAFMLHPGAWPQDQNFWTGFFNPQFVPQVLARTGGSFLLASLYVYLHAAFKIKDPELCRLVESHSTRPALLGALLVVLGGVGWYLFLPESAQAALAAASVLNVLMVLIFAITAAVFVMLYLGPYRNPGWLSPGFAILFLALGFAAVTTGEYIREAVRKPYIIYNVVMSTQILPEEIPILRRVGYLEGGTWTRAFVAARYPHLMREGGIDEPRLLALPEADQVRLGEVLFQYACNNCHALTQGYSPVAHLIRGWTPQMIRMVVLQPERIHFFMPPWAGTREEAELLTKYLVTLAPPHPAGMYYGNGRMPAESPEEIPTPRR